MRWTVAPNGRFTMLWWRPGRIFENVTGIMDLVDGRALMTFDEQPGVVVEFYGRRTGNVVYMEGEDSDHDWDGDGIGDPSDVILELRLKRTGTLIGDLAGTWDATVWRYTSVSMPAETVDLVAEGVSVVLSVALDSHWNLVFTPGGTSAGDLLVEGSALLTRTESREDSPPVEERAYIFTLDRSIWSFTGLAPYDFDGNPATPAEPATLKVVLVRR